MEREFNFNSTPGNSFETISKDDASEKKGKSSKKRSFFDELREKRTEREPKSTASDDSSEKKAEREPTKKELAKEYLEHKSDELKEDLATGTTNKAETEADLAFIQAISEKIDEPGKEAEPAVEEAYQELMEALNESDEESTDEQEPGYQPEQPNEAAQETEESVEDPTPTVHSGASSFTPTTPPPPRSPVTSSPPHPSSPAPTGPLPPPFRPTPPFVATAEAPTLSNNSPENTPEDDARRRVAGKMLVAGAVGYMIGRRGGRKRTEAKLKPEMAKQQEEIGNLKKNVEHKERVIREKANQHEREQELTKSVLQHKIEQSDASKEQLLQIIHDQQGETPQPISGQVRIERPPVQPIESLPAAEQQKGPAPSEKSRPAASERVMPSRIEVIPTPQLLQIAEKITVLDTTVRHLYETNQIDRRGLEEIVKEHLAGHDIAPVLDRRILGREATHERAQELRHDSSHFSASDDSDDLKPSAIHDVILPKFKSTTTKSTSSDFQNIAPLPDTALASSPGTPEPHEPNIQSASDQKNKKMTSVPVLIAIILAILTVIVLFSIG